jgi:hypothetical protein
MTVKLEKCASFQRCGLCLHWVPNEESLDFVVFRDGVEGKLMFGICELKTSQPDSECSCPAFEERVENLDDDFVKTFRKAIDDGNEALIHFRTTGDRSKFKEWWEKYKLGDKT